jgi:hypothetical protein|tara:strand:- start:3195 stop:3590 length:396 start_codon:yes stop_codon:yes gene_type:complete
MADAVTSQTIQDGDRIAVLKFTNISDGTGEAAVKKVDVSALSAESGTGRACTKVAIEQMWYDCSGMTVDILWDASTDVICWTLSGYGFYDWRQAGPLVNNASSPTGDVMFTTTGHDSGDRYTVMVAVRKSY